MTDAPEKTMKRIGLIAGSGQFPLLFSRTAAEKGYAVYAVAFLKETDAALADQVRELEWLHLGQLNRLIRFFNRHAVTEAVMLGGITKTRMFSDVRPDLKAIAFMARMPHTHDDGILSAFADMLAGEGIHIRPATFLLPEMLAPAGCWTRRRPTRAETADMTLGWEMAKAVGKLDIGQCVVVKGGSVLAVEAIDGTDATIRRGGALGGGGAVLVKVCKPIQDTRFDMPAVGLQTVSTMAESGVSVLMVEAAKAVVFDREAMIRLADRHRIAIVAR